MSEQNLPESAPAPKDLFTAMLSDQRFGVASVDKRLQSIDDATRRFMPEDATVDQMLEWKRERAGARMFAKIGYEGMQQVQAELSDPYRTTSSQALGEIIDDITDLETPGYTRPNRFAGETGEPFFDKGQFGDIELGPDDSPVRVNVLPHPTDIIAEVQTPNGPVRIRYDDFSQMPKSGAEWTKALSENEQVMEAYNATGNNWVEEGALAVKRNFKSMGAGALKVVNNAPFAIRSNLYEALAENHDGNEFLRRNTLIVDGEDKGKVVPMPPELEAELKQAVNDELLQWHRNHASPYGSVGEPPDANELFARKHLEMLADKQIEVYGEERIPEYEEMPEGQQGPPEVSDKVFVPNHRFWPLERKSDGTIKHYLRDFDKVPADSLMLAHAAERNRIYAEPLAEEMEILLTKQRATDEVYGRNNGEALRAARGGFIQGIKNTFDQASDVSGQVLPTMGVGVVTGPWGVAAASATSSFSGHYAETFQQVYFDNLQAGVDPGEALMNASDGALAAATFAAPVDVAGDLLLARSLRGMSETMKGLSTTGRASVNRALWKATDALGKAGISEQAAYKGSRVALDILAQGASEAAGEMTRSTIADEYMVNRRGFAKNAKDSLYEGMLAMVGTGGMISFNAASGALFNQIEANRMTKLSSELDFIGNPDTILQEFKNGNAAERAAIVQTLLDARRATKAAEARTGKEKKNHRNLTQLLKDIFSRSGKEEEVVKPPDFSGRQEVSLSSDFMNFDPETEIAESKAKAFEAVGKKVGDVVIDEGRPIRLLEVQPLDDGSVSFIGVDPHGMMVSVPEAKASSLVPIPLETALDEGGFTEANVSPDDTQKAPEPPVETPSADPAPEVNEQPQVSEKPMEGSVEAIWMNGTQVAGAAPTSSAEIKAPTTPTKSDTETLDAGKKTEQAPPPKATEVESRPQAMQRAERNKINSATAIANSYPDQFKAGRVNVAKRTIDNTDTPATAASLHYLGRFFGAEDLMIDDFFEIPALSYTAGNNGMLKNGNAAYVVARDPNTIKEGQPGITRDAIALRQEVFNNASEQKKRELVRHEVYHAHTRLFIERAKINPGVNPEVDAALAEFMGWGDRMIAIGAKELAWMPNGIRKRIENGDVRGAADELLAYGLTDPVFGRQLRMVDENFQPLAKGKSEYDGEGKALPDTKPVSMWDKFMDWLKRVLGLNGLSPSTASLAAEDLTTGSAFNAISRMADTMVKINRGSFVSKDNAAAYATKLGLEDFVIRENASGRFEVVKKLQTENPNYLDPQEAAMSRAALDSVPEMSAILHDNNDTIGSIAESIDDVGGFSMSNADVVAREGAHAWIGGLRDFDTWSKAMRSRHPRADIEGAWNILMDAIGKAFAMGAGKEGKLALDFLGNTEKMKAYQLDLGTGGRAEQTVNDIVRASKTAYARFADDAHSDPVVAMFRYGPEGMPFHRYYEVRKVKGGQAIGMTDLWKKQMQEAIRTGNSQRVMELKDAKEAARFLNRRERAVRKGIDRINQVTKDRFGVDGIPHHVTVKFTRDFFRNELGKEAQDQLAIRLLRSFDQKSRSEADIRKDGRKLAADLRWYAKKKFSLTALSPIRAVGGVGISDASKAARAEAWKGGSAAGRGMGRAHIAVGEWVGMPNWSNTEQSRIAMIRRMAGQVDRQRVGRVLGVDPLELAHQVDPILGLLPVPLSMDSEAYGFFASFIAPEKNRSKTGHIGFSERVLREALGDRLQWQWAKGVINGIRSSYISEFIYGLDGTIMGKTMNLMEITSDPRFFEDHVAPAFIRAALGAVDENGQRRTSTDQFKQIEKGVTLLKKVWDSERKATAAKMRIDNLDNVEAEMARIFDEAVKYNTTRWGNTFEWKGLEPIPGDTAGAIASRIRGAYTYGYTQGIFSEDFSDKRTKEQEEWALENNQRSTARTNKGKISHEEIEELGRLHTETARGLMHLAGWDKGKALSLAVSLASRDGGTSDINIARHIEQLLLQQAGPTHSPSATKRGLDRIADRLGPFMEGLAPTEISGSLLRGGAEVVSMREVIPSIAPESGASQTILNEWFGKMAPSNPVVVYDSTRTDKLFAERVKEMDGRTVNGSHFKTIRDEHGSIHLIDVGGGGTNHRAGSMVEQLGAALSATLLDHLETNQTPWFKKRSQGAIEGMAEMQNRMANQWGNWMTDLQDTLRNSGSAVPIERSLEAMNELVLRWGGKNADPATAIRSVPAVVFAVEILTNQDVRRVLALLPPSSTEPMGKRAEALGARAAAADINAFTEEMTEFGDSADVADVFDDDGFSIGPAITGPVAASMFRPGSLARAIALAADLVEAATGASRKEEAAPLVEKMQDGAGDAINHTLTDVPSMTDRDARLDQENSTIGAIIEGFADSRFGLSRTMKDRITAIAERLAKKGKPFEHPTVEARATPSSLALESQEASGTGILFANRDINDPVARRQQAQREAEDVLNTVLPAKIRAEFSSRPASEEWFNNTVKRQLAELFDYLMEPTSGDVLWKKVTTEIWRGLSSFDGNSQTASDIQWNVLFDAYRDFKSQRMARMFLGDKSVNINPTDYRDMTRMLRSLAHNDAIFRKMGAKSPQTLDAILDFVMLMEYGVDGNAGFTGYRSASEDMERRWEKINSPLGGAAENYVTPQIVGLLTSYIGGWERNRSVQWHIEQIDKSIQNLERDGKGVKRRQFKELPVYKEAWAKIRPIADAYATGMIDHPAFEATMNALLDGKQTKWLKDVREYFDELRPAAEVMSVWTGRGQGYIENYIPMINSPTDGLNSMEDLTWRPIGEKVGSSRVRSAQRRTLGENYMADYNGGRVVNSARGVLFAMKSAESSFLMHDIFGSNHMQGGKQTRTLGTMELLADPTGTHRLSGLASTLGLSPEQQRNANVMAANFRMVFDRERTGFQGSMHSDTLLRRNLARIQQIGAYQALASYEQIYKQTLPGMASFATRLATSPSLALHGVPATLAGLASSGSRAAMLEALRTLAPSIAQRGVEGVSETSRKIAKEILRHSKGLDLANRARNTGINLTHALTEMMRHSLDWTTGKPDGMLTRLIWFMHYADLQSQAGLRGDDIWTRHNPKNAYKAQIAAEELMGQSELTRRGSLMQIKGGTVAQESYATAMRAFASHNVSMAGNLDAWRSELAHGPIPQKLRAMQRIAELGLQQAVFRLLTKPMRDLLLVQIGGALMGWDDDEKETRYYDLLENGPFGLPIDRKSRPIESAEDAWDRMGWSFLADAQVFGGLVPVVGNFAGYYGALPGVQSFTGSIGQDLGATFMNTNYGTDLWTGHEQSLYESVFDASGYMGVFANRLTDVLKTGTSSLANANAAEMPEVLGRLGLMMFATRGVAGRQQQELEDKWKVDEEGGSFDPALYW